MLRQQREPGVAQKGKTGELAGVTRAGTILAPGRVTAAVVADLNGAPVASHQGPPLRRRVVGRLRARHAVARPGDVPAFFFSVVALRTTTILRAKGNSAALAATASGAPSSCCASVSRPRWWRIILPSSARACGSAPAWACNPSLKSAAQAP